MDAFASPVGKNERAMLNQGDLEFIALHSDIDGESYEVSPEEQARGLAPPASLTWYRKQRSRASLIFAGLGLLLIFVVAAIVFEEKPVPNQLAQRKHLETWQAESGAVTKEYELSHVVNEAHDSGKSPNAPSGGAGAKSDAAARVAEAAAASWDLSKLPCRCGCPHGHSPPPSRDHIVQSASDSRKHRSVTLPGGLKAFLTSDPATDFAAAAVNVGAGSADDPKDMQGLAHFLEHMLFMGSEKYPKEDEYSKFLTQNGGYDNAFTADEHTNFFFKVRAIALPEALDRFAQFFAAPLLRESSASREVMAVDAEHHKNLNNDAWRINQIQLSECGGRPAHFGTGDRHTLRGGSKEVVEALRKFHSKNYVAENLRLSILGKESLDDLEKLATSAFEHVRRGAAPVKNLTAIPGPAKDVCHGGNAYVVVPLGDMQALTLAFPSRELLSEEAQRSSAVSLINFVLGGRYEGSLFAGLKKRGWATSVSFNVGVSLTDISTLELQVELTTAGLGAIPDVVDMALGHLRLVVDALEAHAHYLQEDAHSAPPPKEAEKMCNVWSDFESVQALSFHFMENSDPASFVSSIAADLQHVAPRDVLGSNVASTLDAKVTLSITRALDSRLNLPTLWIYAKNFDGGDSLRSVLKKKTEPIYGTTYFEGSFPKELKSRWLGRHAPDPPAEAQLPSNSTEFLPRRLVLQPVPAKGAGEREAAPSVSSVSKNGAQFRFYYKPDAEYRVPKATLRCIASTPAAHAESAAAAAETLMLAVTLQDALEVPLYHAQLAGYSWNFAIHPSGLEISLGGYSGDGLEALARRLAEASAKPPALPHGRFDALLSLQRRETNSQRHEDLYEVGRSYIAAQALLEPSWAWDEQLRALDAVTWESAVQRGKKIWSRSGVSCFAHGDVSIDRARRLATHLATVMALKELPLAKAPLPGVVALPNQKDFTEMRSPPLVASESNSLVMLVYQLEPASCPKDDALCPAALHQAATMLLVSQVASQRAFNELRTKESLGYVVWLWAQPSPVEKVGGKTLWSLRLLVQSGRKSATFVRERMAKFMETFYDQLGGDSIAVDRRRLENTKTDAVTDADIELAKHGLIASLLRKPDSLAAEGERIFLEVLNRREDWARPWQLAKVVESLSRKDCAEVIRQALRPGKDGRKAAVEVWRTEDGDPFSKSSQALHLEDASAMHKWKQHAGNW